MFSMLSRCVMIHISSFGVMNIFCVQPRLLHCRRNLPVLSKIWMRLFSRSLTYTVSCESTATECGMLNSPGAAPRLPHAKRYFPSRRKLPPAQGPDAAGDEKMDM